jgi:hypothetical protein
LNKQYGIVQDFPDESVQKMGAGHRRNPFLPEFTYLFLNLVDKRAIFYICRQNEILICLIKGDKLWNKKKAQ